MATTTDDRDDAREEPKPSPDARGEALRAMRAIADQSAEERAATRRELREMIESSGRSFTSSS
jgi:hypothetical protein